MDSSSEATVLCTKALLPRKWLDIICWWKEANKSLFFFLALLPPAAFAFFFFFFPLNCLSPNPWDFHLILPLCSAEGVEKKSSWVGTCQPAKGSPPLAPWQRIDWPLLKHKFSMTEDKILGKWLIYVFNQQAWYNVVYRCCAHSLPYIPFCVSFSSASIC